MKKIIYISLAFILCVRCIYSYDQATHKYLTLQAWELVRYQHPEVINSEMDIAMKRTNAYTWTGFNTGPWNSKCIVNGSFIEDDHDAAFHEENRVLNCGILGTRTGIFTSSNHFWNPDNGFSYQHNIWTCCGTYGRFNNGRDKLIAYGDGLSSNWTLNYKFNIPWGPYTMQYNGQTIQALIGISYYTVGNGLKGELYVPMIYVWQRIAWWWGWVRHDLSTPEPLSNFVTSSGEREEIRQLLMWEILGRMCHVVEDMGVPAHAHDDPHPVLTGFQEICNDPDYYEHFYIPAERTTKDYMDSYNAGGLIEYSSNWSSTQAAAYSAYIINQVSDRFGSSDEWGDDGYLTAYSSDLAPIYASIGNVTMEPGHGNEVQDVLFAHNYVHSIRRLAGFLYHVFNSASIVPGLPYDLTLSNRTLYYGVNYRALHDMTLDHVNTSFGGNDFTAGNMITIVESNIAPTSLDSYFKIQYLGDNNISPLILFDGGEETYEIDSNYAEREMFYTIRKFRDYEINVLNEDNPGKSHKTDGKEPEYIRDGSNEIDPESYFGEMVINILNGKSIQDVTGVVLMLDTIPVYNNEAEEDQRITLHGQNEHNNIPKEFSLSQNYPNPFNPVTTIKYGLKENVNVKITVYDILGRVVKTLVNEFQDAGYKSVMWDGTNSDGKEVSTGVYLYKIEAGDFVDAKKMLLLR